MNDAQLQGVPGLVRAGFIDAAKRAIDRVNKSHLPSFETLEVLVEVLLGEPPLSTAAAAALARLGGPAFRYLRTQLGGASSVKLDRLRERAQQVPGFAGYEPPTASEVATLQAQARGTDGKQVYNALDRLADVELVTVETIELAIDLMTSELQFQYELSDLMGKRALTYYVKDIAATVVRNFGPQAIDALSARIANPAKPGDEKLLERSVDIGRPLLDLARILVTDGDATRSRAAEAIVAKFASELPIDEAISIYLAVCDRERHTARVMPSILREIWPRLGTPEGRAVIAERWTARGLWPWIEQRLGGEPLAASMLLALLIAGPPEAEKVIREVVAPMGFQATWTATEPMLFVDPVRMGEVFAADPPLYDRLGRQAQHSFVLATSEREHRLAVAFGGHQDVVTEIIKYVITLDAFLKLIAKLRPSRLRESFAARQANPAHRQAKIARALEAIDRGVVPARIELPPPDDDE